MRDILTGIEELDELLAAPDLVAPSDREPPDATAESRPEPIGFVTRTLTGPDGQSVEVEVPVYPASGAAAESPGATRSAELDAADEPVELEDLSELLAAEDAD